MTCPICKPGSKPKDTVCGAYKAGYTCHAGVKEQWSAYRFQWEQNVVTGETCGTLAAGETYHYAEDCFAQGTAYGPLPALAIEALWKKHCEAPALEQVREAQRVLEPDYTPPNTVVPSRSILLPVPETLNPCPRCRRAPRFADLGPWRRAECPSGCVATEGVALGPRGGPDGADMESARLWNLGKFYHEEDDV
jgi:hypothetical protein